MKKNGFTMIEMIAITVVLALILLVSIPSLITMRSNSEAKKKEEYLNNLYIAAESYIVKEGKTDDLTVLDSAVFINIKELIDSGYIKASSLDTDDLTISESSTIKVSLENGRYNYEFYENDITTNAYQIGGLTIHIDGYTNISKATTDLTGNYQIKDSTMTSDNWKGKYIKFDTSANAYFDLDYVTDYSKPITIHSLYKIRENVSEFIWFTYQDVNSYYRIGTGYRAGSFYVKSNTGTVQTYITDLVNQTISETIVIDAANNTIKQYQNGVLIRTITQELAGDINSNKIRIGAWKTAHSADIYSFILYEKELNVDEITRIYQVDQERFGIE